MDQILQHLLLMLRHRHFVLDFKRLFQGVEWIAVQNVVNALKMLRAGNRGDLQCGYNLLDLAQYHVLCQNQRFQFLDIIVADLLQLDLEHQIGIIVVELSVFSFLQFGIDEFLQLFC